MTAPAKEFPSFPGLRTKHPNGRSAAGFVDWKLCRFEPRAFELPRATPQPFLATLEQRIRGVDLDGVGRERVEQRIALRQVFVLPGTQIVEHVQVEMAVPIVAVFDTFAEPVLWRCVPGWWPGDARQDAPLDEPRRRDMPALRPRLDDLPLPAGRG
jgi:hypothetical protein